MSGSELMPIRRVRGGIVSRGLDAVAVEEPLEIRLGFGPSGARRIKSVSVTMRTPGDDFELAAGFLFSEGVIRRAEDIDRIRHCGPQPVGAGSRNVVRVELKAGVAVDLDRLKRHFYTASSCGVCGKTSIEAIKVRGGYAGVAAPSAVRWSPEIISRLPDLLRREQSVFERTGGLHAAGLFGADGELVFLREDVGRHNALDKVVGAALLGGLLPLDRNLIMVSGRASFELVQKAALAGCRFLSAVGAPSSLAVKLAAELDVTLLGFVRDGRFNVYHGAGRVLGAPAAAAR